MILFNISYALHSIKIHYDSRSKSHYVTQSKILCLIILLLHLGPLTSDSNTLYHLRMPSVLLQVIQFLVFTAVHIIPNIYRNIWYKPSSICVDRLFVNSSSDSSGLSRVLEQDYLADQFSYSGCLQGIASLASSTS